MIPLSYLSVLKVSGADAAKFLQAQVTAQLADMKSPAATFSAYCSPKGQVIATLLLAPRQGAWLVVVETGLLPLLQARLQKFILRDDVQLKRLDDHFLFGADTHDTLADGTILLEPRSVPIQYTILAMELPDNPEATARWRRSELLFGIPWLNSASSEKYIPQMLGLDAIGAVSFSKGCYPGQEVIARARHLGQVKRRPQVLDLEGAQAPDVNLPCSIRTMGGEIEATLVHCVSIANEAYTVFAVAALNPEIPITGLEQNGQVWSAKRASKDLPE